MEVPTICNSRKEKEEIILNTIEHLEQHIYILKSSNHARNKRENLRRKW